MKKNYFLLTLVLCCKMGFAQYSGGSGTSGDPYQMTSLNDLVALRNNQSDWNKYFIQTADIDATGSDTLNGGIGWSPIGYYGAEFYGTYDGGNHTISNLYINSPGQDFIGLFGYAYTGSVLKNIRVVNANITGEYEVGGVSGRAQEDSVINCYSCGSISGLLMIGGIVGNSYTGYFSNCYSTATVQGSQTDVGGMLGALQGGSITGCYASGSVTGTGSGSNGKNIGGLVGYVLGSIGNSYATGDVSGNDDVGGLVGFTYGNVTDCYALGAATGVGTYIGGLIGDTVSISSAIIVSDCYYSSTDSAGSGGTALTSDQMLVQSNYNAWDFSTVWALNSGLNSGYPYLRALGASATILNSNCSDILSGVKNISTPDLFTLYPNPTTRQVSVKSDNKLLGAGYVVFDQLGNTVLSGVINSELMIVNMNELASGMYFLKVEKSGSTPVKIVKM